VGEGTRIILLVFHSDALFAIVFFPSNVKLKDTTFVKIVCLPSAVCLLVFQERCKKVIIVEFREGQFTFSQFIVCILADITYVHFTLPSCLGFSQSKKGRAKHGRGEKENGVKHAS